MRRIDLKTANEVAMSYLERAANHLRVNSFPSLFTEQRAVHILYACTTLVQFGKREELSQLELETLLDARSSNRVNPTGRK